MNVRQSHNGQYEAEWPILGGPNTQISEVSGPDVLTWKQDGQKLHVTLQQSSSLAPMTVQMSQSLVLDAASSVTLPSLSLPVLLTAHYTIGEGLDLDGDASNGIKIAPAAAAAVTTSVDLQEVDNAVNQTQKEIAQRFDFKGALVEIEFKRTDSIVNLATNSDMRMEALFDALRGKLIKRGVPVKNLEIVEIDEHQSAARAAPAKVVAHL